MGSTLLLLGRCETDGRLHLVREDTLQYSELESFKVAADFGDGEMHSQLVFACIQLSDYSIANKR